MLSLGGVLHVGLISRKSGFFVISAGIAVILLARFFDASANSEVVGLHCAIMLWGIAWLFRDYKRQTDELIALADAVPAPVWIADADGRITYVNRRFSEFTGKDTAEVAKYQSNDLLHPDDRERVASSWKSTTAAGVDFESKHRIRARDGSYRWCLARAAAVRVHGKADRYCGAAFDVHNATTAMRQMTHGH